MIRISYRPPATLRGPLILLALSCAALPSLSQACATCGCTLSTDAAMGYSATAGWRVNFEYDYIDQAQLRSGSDAVPGVPAGQELEHETTNQYLNLGITYSPDADWNITLRFSYVIRDHTTYGTFDPSMPLPQLTGSHSSSLGDLKLIAGYQGFLPTRNLGIQLGVEILPTGAYGSDVNFNSGPGAGTPLDASLQPGTGSTDLILGGYYYQAISQNWDAFANGTFETALTSKQDQPGNNYRPGNQTLLSVGLRYLADPGFVPQVQINVLHKGPDQGALADVANTAGTAVYFSPGLIVSMAHDLQVYAFVQVPMVSRFDGYQLAPRWTASAGVSYGF